MDTAWHDYFGMLGGVAATLLGLLFVSEGVRAGWLTMCYSRLIFVCLTGMTSVVLLGDLAAAYTSEDGERREIIPVSGGDAGSAGGRRKGRYASCGWPGVDPLFALTPAFRRRHISFVEAKDGRPLG